MSLGMQPVALTVRFPMHTDESDRYHWSGVIETFTGESFNVYMPSVEMVHLDDIAQSLSLICRYNGHIPSFYSVAEHSVRVSMWLYFHLYPLEDQLAGLMHDAAEAYVGDMVRPLKRHGELGFYHQELELGVSATIADKFDVLFPFPEGVHEADKALYYWEVENIRSGKVKGKSPEAAKDMFISHFNALQEKLRMVKEILQ